MASPVSGYPGEDDPLYRIGVMLTLSMSIGHFDDQFNRSFSLPNTQIGFLFREQVT